MGEKEQEFLIIPASVPRNSLSIIVYLDFCPASLRTCGPTETSGLQNPSKLPKQLKYFPSPG
jgi:hypothetical protein